MLSHVKQLLKYVFRLSFQAVRGQGGLQITTPVQNVLKEGMGIYP